MIAQRLADVVLILHAAFALFVVTGGFLVLRWRALMWLHIPAALWGVAVEFGGWICPLTPLENRLRAAAGEAPYSGDFIMHYVSAALYPVSLTRTTQVVLGVFALAINAIAYGLVWRGRRPMGHGTHV
jgi:Protein of Unknown function (DUF2784)